MSKIRMLFSVLAVLMISLWIGDVSYAQEVKRIDVILETGKSSGKQIQEALDMALQDQTGNVLYEVNLPAGQTIELDTLLKVFNYTTIKMNGSTLVRTEEKTMLRIGYEQEVFYGYGGYHDIVIENGTFDGNGQKLKVDASLVRMGHGRNITCRNVTFQNVYNAHHVELAGCENVLFDGCTFKNFYSNKDIVNSANNEALQFDILHNEEHFPRYPGFDDTPCKNVTVQNCTFSNLQRGLGTHSGVAGSYFTNMVFKNNTFMNVKGYAIIATNYKDAVISNNVINKCGAGILFRSMVQGYNTFYTPLDKKVAIDNNSDSLIENNKITVDDYKYKTTAYGISLYGEKLTSKKKDVPKGDYTLKGVTVRNNTIVMNNSGYGLWMQDTDDSTLFNNKVTMNVASSVSGKGNSDCIRLVKSKNNTIEKNTLTQKKKNKKTAQACGIVLTTNSSAVIKNNKISNSPKDGIFVVTKCQAAITNNTINKTGRYGLNVCEKSKVTSKKNKMTKCGKRKTNTYAGGKIK